MSNDVLRSCPPFMCCLIWFVLPTHTVVLCLCCYRCNVLVLFVDSVYCLKQQRKGDHLFKAIVSTKEKHHMAATRTVEEKVQEADKVFTLHPRICSCFSPFSLYFCPQPQDTPFFLMQSPKIVSVIFGAFKKLNFLIQRHRIISEKQHIAGGPYLKTHKLKCRHINQFR